MRLFCKLAETNKTNIMKIQIDLKSAACGLIVGVAAMLTIGAGTPSNDIGRYHVVTTGTFAFVIDSTNGKLWTAHQNSTTTKQTDGDFFDAKKD
jgi:hypothetical protein